MAFLRQRKTLTGRRLRPKPQAPALIFNHLQLENAKNGPSSRLSGETHITGAARPTEAENRQLGAFVGRKNFLHDRAK